MRSNRVRSKLSRRRLVAAGAGDFIALSLSSFVASRITLFGVADASDAIAIEFDRLFVGLRAPLLITTAAVAAAAEAVAPASDCNSLHVAAVGVDDCSVNSDLAIDAGSYE